jgi:sulfate adenylyltransferase
VRGVTELDDPRESPKNPELVLTTTDWTPGNSNRKIFVHLSSQQFVLLD